MATANVDTEVFEDFVICGVCFCEYDEEIRKPKFLPCSHTVCLLCIKEIRQGDTITCPFCRKIISKENPNEEVERILPNNTYALQMIKQNKKFAELTLSAPISKMGSLLSLKEELLKMRDSGVNNLALAIEKRKRVEEQVSQALKCIQAAEEDTKKFQDENNLCLAELISILETKGSKDFSIDRETTSESEEDLVFSQLLSLVEDSNSDDTTETLKQKMKKSTEFYEKKLAEATAVASDYELRQKAKIQFHLFDENDRPIPTCSELEDGFRLIQPSVNEQPTRQDFNLLSHVVFSLLQKQKIPLKSESHEPTNKIISDPTTESPFAKTLPNLFGKPEYFLRRDDSQTASRYSKYVHLLQDSRFSTRPRNPPPQDYPHQSIQRSFRLNSRSKFILRIFQLGRPKGEIHFRSVNTFHPKFVQKLGEFCHESQRNFLCSITKAKSEEFVLLSVSHPKFQPSVPGMINHNKYNCRTLTASQKNEIGITVVKNSAGKVTGWSFFFLLDDFDHFGYHANLPDSLSECEYFGDVSTHRRTLDALSHLSRVNKSERTLFNFTLESE